MHGSVSAAGSFAARPKPSRPGVEVTTMAIVIREIGPDEYARYAEIDPSYEVTSVLRVVPKDGGLAGLEFVEEAVETPYRKGGDTPDDSPSFWPPKTENGEFVAFLAEEDSFAVGGAAVVLNPSGAFLLERRSSLAGLWDIRVHPRYRHRGIGSTLLLHAAGWAGRRGCSQLRVECQNVNVTACRFYAKHCALGGIERYGYAAFPDVAHETMLLWYRDL